MADLLATVVENVEQLERELGESAKPNLENSRVWAKALKAGKVLFYNHQEVQVGHRNIDWTGAHVAHQEWPAQLNRFFWLSPLAAVYRDAADESLADIARTTIEDWIDQHDYSAERPPAKGDNTLNISIRLGQGTQPGWWGTVRDFAASPHYDEALLQQNGGFDARTVAMPSVPPGRSGQLADQPPGLPVVLRNGRTGTGEVRRLCREASERGLLSTDPP